jgi:hypothetical protein
LGNTEDTMISKMKQEVSTKQEQIAKNARTLPTVSFTSLAYHIDFDTIDHGMLREVLKKRVRDGVIIKFIILLSKRIFD